MAPKPAKGSGKKTETPAGNKNWEAALTKEVFEEDSWKACVSLVVETSPEDEELIQALAVAVQKPLRKLFTILTWDDTQAKIHEFGNPKNKKRDNVPMFSEVTEPAKVLLDAGEDIPVNLLAKLVKFQLLQIKINDLQRRQAEQLKPVEEKADGSRSAGKEKGGGKDKKGKPPSPVLEKKTKLKRRDEVDPPDYIDDEPDDGPQHYILMLGFYHPHLFGALDSIGIQVSNVIKLLHQTKGQQGEHNAESNKDIDNTPANKDTELEDDCMTRLAAQAKRLEHFWSGLRPHLDSGPPESKLHDVAEMNYTVTLPSINIQDPEAMLTFGTSIFEGIACLIYDTLDWRRQHQHYLDNIKIIDVPKLRASDPQPAEPVVSTPLPRSKKKPVHEESLPTQETKVLSTDVDMSQYNKLLDMVPPEACSVPLMLHCMLEQVVFSSDLSVPVLSDEAEEPRGNDGPYLDQQLVSCMLQGFLPLVHAENERSRLLNGLLSMVHSKEDKKRLLRKFGSDEKKSGDPQVVRHHDERALRLRNSHAVEEFDPVEVERNMLKMSPVCDLIQSVAQQRNASCWMAIKQQLQYYCTNDVVSWPEVEHLFHQSVFESMPLTKLDCRGALQKPTETLDSLGSAPLTPTTIPWDDPLSFAKQQLWHHQNKGPAFLTEDPGNTEVNKEVCIHLELSDIQSYRQRSLFDWHYTEHHSATTFPQVLQVASEQYKCLDTFRGSNKNILYIYCHNPMNKHRQFTESWDVALHTNIKFRKYLENVADKIPDWTKEEESKREAMKSQQNVTPVETPEAEDIAATPTEKEPELEPVIRKESLKAWKLEQEQLKEEELAKKAKKEPAQKGKQAREDTAGKDSKKGQNNVPQSAKKSRADTASSAKTLTESIKVDENKEPRQAEEDFKGFIGYNMDGKLIHVSGNLQCLYPSDGGCIIVETASYVEGSSLMKVAVKKDGHNFYMHINRTVEELSGHPIQSPNKSSINKEKNKVSAGITRVKQGSLTAVLDNGIRLSYSFYGPTGQHIENLQETSAQLPETATPNLENQDSKETQADLLNNKPQHPSSPTEPPESQVHEVGVVPSSCPFNSLSLSLPSGLLLQLLCEDTQGVPSEELGMLVRQSFQLHGKGDVGAIPDASLSKEVSRLITSQGAVVRNMKDGSTEVLFADGSVSFSQDSGPVWEPVSGTEDKAQVTGDDREEQTAPHNGETERGFWSTTTPSGARICTVGTTHKRLPTPPLLVFKATDPMTHEVMLTREDRVVSVQNSNGSITVEHADGTRITSLYEDTLAMHRGERPESTTLKSSSAECVCGSIECICATRCAESHDENSGGESTANNTTYMEFGNEGRERETTTTVCESSEEESVTGSRKSSKSENECVPIKERVVLVEKEGCVTVVMYPDRRMAHIFLADGTVITGNNKGAYQVFPPTAGLLQIHSDGKCVYSSDPLDTPSPKGETPINQTGCYTMSHSDSVACDITDPDGNHFQVMEDGTISVLNLSPASRKLGKEDEEDREIARSTGKHNEHGPRLFIVHENGSGTELLHSQMVEELLFQAYSDPTVAIMKEPMPDTQDEFGITILKPCHESVWSQWLLAKQKPDITPPNLRNRSWHDFPRAEAQKPIPGPLFGTNLGRSLTFTPRSGGSVTQIQAVRSCPKVLEMRDLRQHRPFTSPLKNTLDSQLKEYVESLMEKEQRSEQMKIKDPRSGKESENASDLLNLVLSFAEEENFSHNSEKRISDICSLYMQRVGAPVESDASDDTSTPATESFAIRKDSKWTGRLAQYRQELCEEKACREALRKNTVVPYFHLENLSLYESLLYQELSNVKSTVSPVSHNTEVQDRRERPKLLPSPRPTKSTASQSTSHTGERVAAKSPSASPPQTLAERHLKTSVPSKAVHVDVTGQPRKSKVRLPTCIKTSKPSSVPNHQFLSVEEPVRRKCRTISLTNPAFIMRGFHLHPPRVDFGPVQEGTTSSVTVVMKNVGVDTCRFNVKQPPASSGLRVIYNPGPVAAGLHVELQVQLLALYAVQAGEAETKKSLSQDIAIHTETEILYLPVTATILSERLYDIWLKEHSGHSKKGSRTSKLSEQTKGDLKNRLSL